MSKINKEQISAKGFSIQIYTEDFKNDYISLTDIAKYKNTDDPRFVIQNWMRNRNTLEFIGLWEALNNPNFNRVQFDTFRNEAGLNRFTMTPSKWIESTDAIGIVSKAGRYGGTYAHYDIAMEFASWLSPEFKLYIIQDYKRLKEDENSKLSLTWNLHREVSKINYKIHTDASLNELLVLANMESYNAILIGKGMDQKERMTELRKLARTQLMSIENLNNSGIRRLERNK